MGKRCNLDAGRNDSKEDPDHDGLLNYEEFLPATLPCAPDIDHGGELDGSEVDAGHNLHWAGDDSGARLGPILISAFNEGVTIHWTPPNRE